MGKSGRPRTDVSKVNSVSIASKATQASSNLTKTSKHLQNLGEVNSESKRVRKGVVHYDDNFKKESVAKTGRPTKSPNMSQLKNSKQRIVKSEPSVGKSARIASQSKIIQNAEVVRSSKRKGAENNDSKSNSRERKVPAERRKPMTVVEKRCATRLREKESNAFKGFATQKLTKEELEKFDLEQEPQKKMDRIYRTDWSGNSDSKGSVDSACLDEDICYECGESTTDMKEEDFDKIVLCERCEGEFHLICVNKECLPRKQVDFFCPRCLEEEIQFNDLSYDIVVKDWKGRRVSTEFKIKKGRAKVGLSFSPSRPLELAWQEFQEKQFMCVSRVFDFETMRKLTHGTVEMRTGTGRVSSVWSGVLNEISKCLKSGIMTNLIHRDGRYDFRLPDNLIKELQLEQKLEPILAKLRTIMGTPAPEIRTHNVVFVPVGSEHQKWHADDTLTLLKKQRYFTLLIHLNLTDENGGGTEVWSRKLKRGDLIRGRPGDAFVFNGSMLHRGQGNSGLKHRVFYYASFACRPDANADYAE